MLYIEDCFESPFLKKVSLKLSPKTFDPELGKEGLSPLLPSSILEVLHI
jgi:hypothetical protein